jgi:hypothetical protein
MQIASTDSGKSEEAFMRSLIILSIVVLLKIEQELTRSLAARTVSRRRRARDRG